MKIIPRHHFYFNYKWFLDYFLFKLFNGTNNLAHEMENKFIDFFDSKDAKFFSSATSAFVFLLNTLEISDGSTFLIPEYNYFIYEKILPKLGYKVKTVPVNKGLLIDPSKLEDHITEGVKALIVMNLFSRCPELDKIEAICKNHNILMISDNAHSFKTIYKEKYSASYGDYSIFSFGIGKSLMAFGGGALISNNEMLSKNKYNRLSIDNSFKKIINGLIQHFFTSRLPYSIFVFPFFWVLNKINRDFLEKKFFDDEIHYSFSDPMKMPDIRLFILKKQLEIYDSHAENIIKMGEMIKDFIKDSSLSHENIQSLSLKADYLFFQLNSSRALAKYLLNNGIDCRYDYCHYSNKEYAEKSILLPLYFSMKKDDIKYMLKKINTFIKK